MNRAILCVDDEAIIVLSLKEELRTHYLDRFVYETALNAGEALAIIEKLAAAGITVITVISDWIMPGISGEEFLARVHATHPEIRAIVVTGHSDEASLVRMNRTQGLTAVLKKPWSTADLIEAVDRCIA
jgi:DNA-binding NtrC family response regulator